MVQSLDDSLIKRIFSEAGLGDVCSVHKVEAGFCNDVYSIDDEYILKATRWREDEEGFRREVYLCDLLAGRVPAPKVVMSDTSKTLVDRFYAIYEKIPGDNLYEKWHLFSDDQRRELMRQLCTILRRINETPYQEFARRFDIDVSQTWHDRMLSMIDKYLGPVIKRKLLSPDLTRQTTSFLESKTTVLREQRMALTYFDAHFDNILVSDGRITGILDFERTDVTSTDYVLDLVRRMAKHPAKYTSVESERLVKLEDYSKLMQWYREFYPELFDYRDLDTRLAVYAVEHCLVELFYFPDSQAAREELAECTSGA